MQWEGYNAANGESKSGGMKGTMGGRQWAPQHYDPEYTPGRDVSPKRAILNKKGHLSDRSTVSLRTLLQMTEEEAMTSLLDGGFLNDVCLDNSCQVVLCPGILNLAYSSSDTRGQVIRMMACTGVKNAQRHRMHWLQGSVLQGRTKLDALDVGV